MNIQLNKTDQFTVEAGGLSKKFNNRVLFKGISFSLKTGGSRAVTGPNGSGKSTLLEIMASLRMPTRGEVSYFQGEEKVPVEKIYSLSGFSSFRVNPYGELSGYENIVFASGKAGDLLARADDFLKMLKLHPDRDKRVKYYSSGMKQRMRFLLAVINDPPILFLDEPGANLDSEGKDIIYSYIKSVKSKKIILIATNEEEEAALCDDRISLGK